MKTQALWKKFLYQTIAQEISCFTRYYDRLLQWQPLKSDLGLLFESIDCAHKEQVDNLPDLRHEKDLRTAILLNGNLNYHLDIQDLLDELKPKLARTSRVVVVAYNSYLSWLYRFVNWMGLRKGEVPSTFLTHSDLENLAVLSGFEIVRSRPAGFCPFRLLGLGSFLNRLCCALPVVRWFGLVEIMVLRPLLKKSDQAPSLTVVIPARNEKGNIENALIRLPDLGTQIEVIFVEGHSKDGTWEEIQRVIPLYSDRYKISAFQQTGKGKNDAVRLGFSHAQGEILTILDADLTMPPELLGRFYNAYHQGLADFVNGTRLVYPMEGEAMRPLNRLGNIFFAKALSSVLDSRLGDSLCGTKLLARSDYHRIIRWRKDFGDFDPFGDFELLFPAAVLGLGITDIPIRYRARTYGSTNINRFRHGLLLLRMTLIGWSRIKMGRAA